MWVGEAASFLFRGIALCSNKEEKARTFHIDADNHDSSRATKYNQQGDLALTCAGAERVSNTDKQQCPNLRHLQNLQIVNP